MSDTRINTSNRSNTQVNEIGSGNLLDSIGQQLQQLPEQQRNAVVSRVIDEKVALDVAAKQAQLRYDSSTADMYNLIHQIGETERNTKADYTIKGDFSTASGSLNVTVKKSNNMVIIVLAIAVVIVVMLMIRK